MFLVFLSRFGAFLRSELRNAHFKWQNRISFFEFYMLPNTWSNLFNFINSNACVDKHSQSSLFYLNLKSAHALKFSKLFNLLVHIKKAVSHFFEQVAMLWYIHANDYVLSYIISRLFMLINMYYNGSLLNSLTTHNIQALVHSKPLHAKWLKKSL